MIAKELSIGGQPASAWFGIDPTSDAQVDAPPESESALATRKSPDGKELPVTMTIERKVIVSVPLK